jgi:predicted anti-sigma-YlaC factor YlaD
MTCKEVTRLISESLDKDLSLPQRLVIQIHFRFCGFCKRYERQLLFLRNMFRGLSKRIEDSESLPDDLPSLSVEAQDRMKRRLRGETQNEDGKTD